MLHLSNKYMHLIGIICFDKIFCFKRGLQFFVKQATSLVLMLIMKASYA